MYSRRNWPVWKLSLVSWTAYGALHVIGSYVYVTSTRSEDALSQALLYNFALACSWALASLPLLSVARRFGFERVKWKASLAVHAVACVAATAAVACFIVAWTRIFGLDDALTPLIASFAMYFQDNLPVGPAVMALAHAVQYYGRFRERQLESARLETRLAQAQLEILRSQLEPHFLFNTLNSIAALTRRDPEAAERMTLQLSSLLRVSLDCDGAQLVPLQQELRLLQSYLDIQQTRFQDRLTVRMAIDPGSLSLLVPSIMLQPLVENAIRHGIARSAAPGRLEISASKQGESLIIEIEDNGVGLMTGAQTSSSGFGLRNTRARLEQLYGNRHRLRLQSGQGGGCRVTLELPAAPPALAVA